MLLDTYYVLLTLYEDKSRASADVKELSQAKLSEIDRKIRELTELRRTLEHLVHACHGNDRPDCPILAELSGERDA